jgi:hypothetical protein
VFLLKEVSTIFHFNVEVLSTTLCTALNAYKQKHAVVVQDTFPYLVTIKFSLFKP